MSTEALVGTGKNQTSLATLGVEQVAEYSCAGIETVRKLRDNLEEELKQLELWTLFNELEMSRGSSVGSYGEEWHCFRR